MITTKEKKKLRKVEESLIEGSRKFSVQEISDFLIGIGRKFDKWLKDTFDNRTAIAELNKTTVYSHLPRMSFDNTMFVSTVGQKWRRWLGPLRACSDLIYRYKAANRGHVIAFSTTQKILNTMDLGVNERRKLVRLLVQFNVLRCIDGKTFSIPGFGRKERYYMVDDNNLQAFTEFLDSVKAKETKDYIKFHEVEYFDYRKAKKVLAEAKLTPEIEAALNKIELGKNVCRLNLPGVSDDIIAAKLMEKYPYIETIFRIMEGLNEMLGENVYNGMIHIHHSRKNSVTGASFRPYSYACNLKKKADDFHSSSAINTRKSMERASAELDADLTDDGRNVYLCRKDYLRDVLGTDNIGEYDMSASIHSLEYAMRHGGNLPDMDVYTELQFPEETDYVRRNCSVDDFDAFRMGAKKATTIRRFTTSRKQATNSILRTRNSWNIHASYGAKKMWAADIVDTSIDKLGNGSRSTEIFAIEACVYMMVVEEFMKKGVKLVLVYDCFYYDASRVSQTMIQESIERNVRKFHSKYISK